MDLPPAPDVRTPSVLGSWASPHLGFGAGIGEGACQGQRAGGVRAQRGGTEADPAELVGGDADDITDQVR
ncbi:hypothetical protein AAFF_G00244060 [Aldrovandia affinis]|uniref:Uncharacterized protein n=1 Tax=Aldrovandia affinis TaxID=143900 RepID=A0AAD7RDW8_9TELE|nr:hypothetical protein AAFF_G00244060 [Aldrovandia affinis]